MKVHPDLTLVIAGPDGAAEIVYKKDLKGLEGKDREKELGLDK